eukprot:g6137.t1
MQERFMRRAIELALDAERLGGDPYGALIADPTKGVIVAEGHNHAAHNPIWHGEMAAIANLSALQSANESVYAVAGNLELYTTAEPCPMCMSAIEWAGFGAVVYGASIPFVTSTGRKQIQVRATDIRARSAKDVAGDSPHHACNDSADDSRRVNNHNYDSNAMTLPLHDHGSGNVDLDRDDCDDGRDPIHDSSGDNGGHYDHNSYDQAYGSGDDNPWQIRCGPGDGALASTGEFSFSTAFGTA